MCSLYFMYFRNSEIDVTIVFKDNVLYRSRFIYATWLFDVGFSYVFIGNPKPNLSTSTEATRFFKADLLVARMHFWPWGRGILRRDVFLETRTVKKRVDFVSKRHVVVFAFLVVLAPFLKYMTKPQNRHFFEMI